MGTDGWLLVAFIWIDISILFFAAVLIVSRFPSRIRSAAGKNSQRLDGSTSKRRKSIERSHYIGFLFNTMAVIVAVLLISNVAVFVVHKKLVPIPLAVDSISRFQWNKDAWKADLMDGQTGNLAGQFRDWQKANNSKSTRSLFELVATWPIVFAIGLAAIVTALISLGRLYISALIKFEADIASRYRDYFSHDMRSRHQSIESTASQDEPLDIR